MKKLPPVVQNILQLLTMIVLAFIFGALILLGANYFDDRPNEAAIFFLIIGGLAVVNWIWTRRKSRKLSTEETAVAEEITKEEQM